MINQGTIKKRVDEVMVGDMVDLEGDEYADPEVIDDDETSEPRSHGRMEFTFKFAVVQEIETGTFSTIVLHTSQGSFAFPTEHLIEWKEKDVD